MDAVPLLRPLVDELSFMVYGRPLHPELFEIAAAETVTRADFQATVRITRGGHVITWTPRQGPSFFLTEVVGPDEAHLPGGRLVSHAFRQERAAALQPLPGVRYQACFQTETLPPELFQRVNDELLRDAKRRGFIHFFPPTSGFGAAPLGFVTMDGRAGCQLVHAFHTYPEECTIVKTQSLFETDL